MTKQFIALCCVLLVLAYACQLTIAQHGRQGRERRPGRGRNPTGTQTRNRDRNRQRERFVLPANRAQSSSLDDALNSLFGSSSTFTFDWNSLSVSIGDSTFSVGTDTFEGINIPQIGISESSPAPSLVVPEIVVASQTVTTAPAVKPWRGKGSFTGDLRLGCIGKKCTKGVVEVYNREEDVWGTICANGWGQEDAQMVCNYLKFSKGAKKALRLMRKKVPMSSRHLVSVYQNMGCTGTEDSITECRGEQTDSAGTCRPDRLAGVQCAGTIQDNQQPVECDSTDVRCSNRQKCIQPTYKCDGMSDCPWGTDERNCARDTCPSNSFYCGTSEAGCISQLLVCNGEDDCGNGNDEADCGDHLTHFSKRDRVKLALAVKDYNSGWRHASPYTCAQKCLEEKSFRCAAFDYSKAARECYLSTRAIADTAGLIRPASGSENWAHYTLNTPPVCTEFVCGNRCITRDRVCNDFVDCLDGTDEEECGNNPEELPENFQIRLRGGASRLEGRLEVSAGDDDFGLVCDIGWTIREANVVCRMLGFSRGALIALSGQFFRRTTLAYKISGLRCQGHENELSECEHDAWNRPTCTMDHEAGVVCLGETTVTLRPPTAQPSTASTTTTRTSTRATTTTTTTSRPRVTTPAPEGCGLKPPHGLHVRPRVVGGYNALPHEWPWQAGIWLPWGFKCGATLIASCWVLTAAHCFINPYPLKDYTIRLGDHQTKVVDGTEQYMRIRRYINHNYSKTTNDNDISLIELQPTADGRCAVFNNNVKPACIPTSPSQFPAKHPCYIIGWGQTSTNSNAPPFTAVLQEAKVPLISRQECLRSSVYGSLLGRNMMCAGYMAGGIDTCQGDSGGPLLCFDDSTDRYYIWGVVSWGHGCAKPRAPGIYTIVHNYRTWIRSVTGLSL